MKKPTIYEALKSELNREPTGVEIKNEVIRIIKGEKIECSKCHLGFERYWLKDGMCNGCRNPHLIVTAKDKL